MIQKTVAQLVKRYGTNDPFVIASERNIPVHFFDLMGILGHLQRYKRSFAICIHQGLDDMMRRYVCAHELGHSLLHPDLNTPFLRANTLQSVDKIERQANQFAVELLIPDQLLLEGATIYEAAALCGVPEEVAHLKKKPKHSF
ncbi:Metallopeptidase ImmA [compost metagenome]